MKMNTSTTHNNHAPSSQRRAMSAVSGNTTNKFRTTEHHSFPACYSHHFAPPSQTAAPDHHKIATLRPHHRTNNPHPTHPHHSHPQNFLHHREPKIKPNPTAPAPKVN